MISSIRELHIDDVVAVAALVMDSFDPHLQPFMTYTQRGIAQFLAVPARYRSAMPSVVALVATAETTTGQVIAFADFRILDGEKAHLSYICVSAQARGQGLATSLISRFLELNRNVRELQLDVFDDNTAALSLYAKLGFVTKDGSYWLKRDIPAASGAVTIANLPFAEAAHSLFGFCELDVVHGARPVRYGRLGDTVIRAQTVEHFEDDKVLAALRATFPAARTAFCVVRESGLSRVSVDYSLVVASKRLTLEMTEDVATRIGASL